MSTNLADTRKMEREQDTDDEFISLMDLLLYLRSHLLVIIFVFVFSAMLATVGAFFLITPTYESSSEIYIVSASNDSVVNLTDLQIGSSLASDYEDLLISRPMMESVLENLNLDYTVKELRNMIEIENPDDTRILKITVTTEDRQLSADIANEIAELSVEWLPSVMECETPNIVEDAIPATEKAGPNLKKDAAIGAVLGLIIVVGIYTIIYINDDTIRTGEDLERYFGMVALATIPEDASNPGLKIKKDKDKKNSKKAKAKRKKAEK